MPARRWPLHSNAGWLCHSARGSCHRVGWNTRRYSESTLGRAECAVAGPGAMLRQGVLAGHPTLETAKEGIVMGLDDLVNKAKDLLGGAGAKTQEAAADAQAGSTEAAAGASEQASGLIDQAKGLLTDERIDQVAGAIKDKTPDQVDSVVETIAEKGKEFNN